MIAVFLAAASTHSANAVRFRCGVMSFLGKDFACSASCWLQGQTSGTCDADGNCNCSETDNGVLDKIKETAKTFINEVDSWEITKKVKDVVPSRCRLGNE